MTSRGQAEFCGADIDADHVAILEHDALLLIGCGSTKIKSLAAHAQTRIALLGNGEGHRIGTQYRRDQPLGRRAGLATMPTQNSDCLACPGPEMIALKVDSRP
jgi:hypothetical protein